MVLLVFLAVVEALLLRPLLGLCERPELCRMPSCEAALTGLSEVVPALLRRLDLDALRLDTGLHGLLDGGR